MVKEPKGIASISWFGPGSEKRALWSECEVVGSRDRAPSCSVVGSSLSSSTNSVLPQGALPTSAEHFPRESRVRPQIEWEYGRARGVRAALGIANVNWIPRILHKMIRSQQPEPRVELIIMKPLSIQSSNPFRFYIKVANEFVCKMEFSIG